MVVRLLFLGCLRGANAPLSNFFPLSFEGEGDRGGEVDLSSGFLETISSHLSSNRIWGHIPQPHFVNFSSHPPTFELPLYIFTPISFSPKF